MDKHEALWVGSSMFCLESHVCCLGRSYYTELKKAESIRIYFFTFCRLEAQDQNIALFPSEALLLDLQIAASFCVPTWSICTKP